MQCTDIGVAGTCIRIVAVQMEYTYVGVVGEDMAVPLQYTHIGFEAEHKAVPVQYPHIEVALEHTVAPVRYVHVGIAAKQTAVPPVKPPLYRRTCKRSGVHLWAYLRVL